ncbi:efflux RND transporter periplasmic adaptor subunit [Fulvimarina endophytica]|uniref:Efflux RND transporter periplasmic adaptor subunit n=2 Tax=Fulvimarina endophytica TaxID=2293836 RepID=A0A371X4F6_9HYPH|nr:efflux RND transporter periplasmic adaptor subunit [Fulvimarina endophytica]
MEPDAHTLIARHERIAGRRTAKDDMTTDRTPADPQTPRKEPRSKAGWLALLFVLALVGWMGSGYLAEEPAAPVAETPRAKASQPFTVEAFRSTAKPVVQFVSAEGQARPDRQTPVRAKTGGTIEEIAARKGQFLNEGDLIARIALDDRSAQIAQAEAELARRQGDFDRVSGLVERGYATTAELGQVRAELAVAEASLATIRQSEGDTAIRAPITGTLENFDLDLGEFIAAAAEIGVQIDTDPLTVEVQVAQQSIGQIQLGQKAQVNFITGVSREGEVTYVATNASASTRTFPVEITIPNPDREIPAGISAQVRIPVGETPAHFLSAAILALGPNGELGIKAVDDQSRVKFYPAELVRAETDGIWVTGLPESLSIISVGQGFVSDGEPVNAKAPSKDDPIVETPADAPAEPALPGIAEASTQEGTDANADAGATTGATTGVSAEAGDPSADPRIAALATEAAQGAAISLPEAAALASRLQEGAAPEPDLVRMAQEVLNRLGYEAGPADGRLGEATRTAIRAFQADYGLETTGDLGEAFAGALTRALGSQTGGGDAR